MTKLSLDESGKNDKIQRVEFHWFGFPYVSMSVSTNNNGYTSIGLGASRMVEVVEKTNHNVALIRFCDVTTLLCFVTLRYFLCCKRWVSCGSSL